MLYLVGALQWCSFIVTLLRVMEKKNLHQVQDILKFNGTLQPSVLQVKVKRRAIETGSLCRIPVKPGNLMLDGLWGRFKASSEVWLKIPRIIWFKIVCKP